MNPCDICGRPHDRLYYRVSAINRGVAFLACHDCADTLAEPYDILVDHIHWMIDHPDDHMEGDGFAGEISGDYITIVRDTLQRTGTKEMALRRHCRDIYERYIAALEEEEESGRI